MRSLFRALGPATVLLGLGLLRPAAAQESVLADGSFLDLPAGFQLAEGDGRTRFSYLSPDGRIELDLLLLEPGQGDSAEALAEKLLGRLGSQGLRTAFLYQGRQAVLAELSFVLDGSPRRGYALFLPSPSGPGGGRALLAHAPAGSFEAAADFILSCLDGFSPDRAALLLPGPLSQFLLPFPPPRPGRKAAELPGGRVELPWSAEEAEQELDTVRREYRVLASYLADAVHWREAWARFYRLVYRESSARLAAFTEAFARGLPRADPTESARRALAWVQGFTFERDPAGLDFVPPLAAAFERRGDCDSRALVMAVILEAQGIDCLLLLSREYSHALLAVDVPGGGQRFPFAGREYLVAETTARVGLGRLDSSQADFSKWLAVPLGDAGPRGR